VFYREPASNSWLSATCAIENERSPRKRPPQVPEVRKGGNAMVKERRRKNKVDLKEFVRRGEWQAGAEVDALEVLMRESYNNPEVFHEEWLRPLLREGLTLESAYDVLVEGTIRPN
jgi:hypothetical protein